MVNIDALLNEWAYRCEKGYPDMDSPSDLRVLKNILKEQGISLPLSEDLAAAGQAIAPKEIDSKKEFFELLDQIDLSKQDIQKGSTMVIQFDPDFKLDEEEDLSNKIVDNKLSVRQAENFVQLFKKKRQKSKITKDTNIMALELSVSNKIGLNVEIQNNKRNKGKISFEYKDLDQLNKIIDIIKSNY